jgi:hypothetical protein
MAWLCTNGEIPGSSQMCIVPGPNIEMATKLIRMKGIFEPKLGLPFSNKETVFRHFLYKLRQVFIICRLPQHCKISGKWLERTDKNCRCGKSLC